jgi:hypothetical protein
MPRAGPHAKDGAAAARTGELLGGDLEGRRLLRGQDERRRADRHA